MANIDFDLHIRPNKIIIHGTGSIHHYLVRTSSSTFSRVQICPSLFCFIGVQVERTASRQISTVSAIGDIDHSSLGVTNRHHGSEFTGVPWNLARSPDVFSFLNYIETLSQMSWLSWPKVAVSSQIFKLGRHASELSRLPIRSPYRLGGA